MAEAFVSFPSNVQVKVRIDAVGVIPGISKHLLWLRAALTPLNNQSDAATLSLAGEVFLDGGSGGYLGTIVPTAPITMRSHGEFQSNLLVEVTDDQIRKIEDRRNGADGSFNIKVSFRATGSEQGGAPLFNTFDLSSVRVSRDDWANILTQVGFRRTLIVELEVPEAATKPEMAKSLDYFKQAQTLFAAGDYRRTAEGLRQALAALVGEPAEVEATFDAMTVEFKDVHKRKGDYSDRLEFTRKTLKFVADLGAHPETDDTHKAEALAQIHMAAGIIYWYMRGS